MNTRLSFGILAAVAGVSICLLGTSLARATVLTFDKTPQFVAGNLLYGAPDSIRFPDYGDNVVGASQLAAAAPGRPAGTTFLYGIAGGPTPNIVANYPNNIEVYRDGTVSDYPTAPSLLPNFANASVQRMVTLVGDDLPGVFYWAASLESFSIHTYGTANRTFQYVAVLDADTSQVLWSDGAIGSGVPITVVHATGKTYNTANFGGPLRAQRLAIDFQPLSASHNAWGFDDIQFAQVQLPEPTSLALLAVGAGALVVRRRRTCRC